MCNESVLGTATGPVKLRARFVPEDIGIKWYDGNTQVNVSDTSKTCTYDTAINLPPTPTKTGYEFKGWKVAQYDFSTLDYRIVGTAAHADGMTWTVIFPYGDVSGVALCSITNGTFAVAGTPVEGGGGDRKYCWCKATGFKPSGENIVCAPVSSSGWVFRYDVGSAYVCSADCTRACIYSLASPSIAGMRRALFGIIQQ